MFFQPIEIDRLREELGSAEFTSAASSLIVAIGGHHHDGQIGTTLLNLVEQLEAVHPRILMSEKTAVSLG